MLYQYNKLLLDYINYSLEWFVHERRAFKLQGEMVLKPWAENIIPFREVKIQLTQSW